MALASPQLLLVYFVLETLSRAAGLMLWQLSRGVDVPGGSSRVVGLDNERATSSALCRLDFDSLLNILPPATRIESVKVLIDCISNYKFWNLEEKKFVSFGAKIFLFFCSLLVIFLINTGQFGREDVSFLNLKWLTGNISIEIKFKRMKFFIYILNAALLDFWDTRKKKLSV